jgi:hypothetical protein
MRVSEGSTAQSRTLMRSLDFGIKAGRGSEVTSLKDTGAGGELMKAERHGTAIAVARA